MDYPNDVVSLRRAADIIEGFWTLAPEFRDLVMMKITPVTVRAANMTALEKIKAQYLQDRDKLSAIRQVRNLYLNPLTKETMGLKESKDLVESWF